MFYGYSKDICVEEEPKTLTILSSGEEEQESDNKREPATEKSQLRGKVPQQQNTILPQENVVRSGTITYLS